jgi:DNA phosphorothioation-dependent restriction protein DptH
MKPTTNYPASSGSRYLVPNDRRKMNLVFEVNPHPGKVSGLDHFTVQIVSQNDGPVGKSKKVKAWTPSRLQCTVNLDKLNKIEFEEGWHFIRVLPWTADGDPIPLEADSGSEAAKRSYESEPFYVLPGGSIEEEPPQRAIPIEQSLEHARFRLQLTALGDERDPDEIAISGVTWADGGRSKKASRQETLLAKFGHEGAVQIPLSRMLKTIEQRILAEPMHPSGWRMQINLDAAELPSEVGLTLQLPPRWHRSWLPGRAVCYSAQGHRRADHAGALLPEIRRRTAWRMLKPILIW